MVEVLEKKQKSYKAGGIILFTGAMALLVCRYVISLLFPSVTTAEDELLSTAVFDFFVQVVFLLGTTVVVGKYYLGYDVKQYLENSNVVKTSIPVLLVGILVGILIPVLSTIINIIFNSIFLLLGVRLSSASTIFPEQFNIWYLLAYVFLGCVLPAVCEEIFNRGIVLGSLRSRFEEWQTILIGGLVFGLFHQYILQTPYTAVFGMVLTCIALRTRTILPCMVIHFVNNLVSTIGEFALFYNWKILSLADMVLSLPLPFMILASGAVLVALYFAVKLLISLSDKYNAKTIAKKIGIPYSDDLGVEVVGGRLNDCVYYKPAKRETAFYWGAFAIALLSTIATLIWRMV